MKDISQVRVDELMHHGVLGQKWGVRNGPPYPLKPGAHSASERKAGWRKSLNSGSSGEGRNRKKLTGNPLAIAATVIPTVSIISNNIGAAVIGIKQMKLGKEAVDILDKKKINYTKLDEIEKKFDKTQRAKQMLNNFTAPLSAIPSAIGTGIGRKREIEAMEARNGLSIDKKTGLYLKKNRSATSEEDVKSVNPGFQRFSTDMSAKNNCVLCSATYDLRRRGYEVNARKTNFGRKFDNTVEQWYKGAKRVKVDVPTERGLLGVKASKKQIEQAITSSMGKLPDGSRGVIHIDQGTYGINHAMAFEKKGGVVTFPDSQVGKINSTANLAKIMKRGGNLSYYRLDHIQPDIEAMKKECVR